MAGGSRELASGGQPVKASTAELRNVAGQRLAVWQWYWIGGRLTSSDHLAKLWQAVHRLLGEGNPVLQRVDWPWLNRVASNYLSLDVAWTLFALCAATLHGWVFWAIRQYPDGTEKHIYRHLLR